MLKMAQFKKPHVGSISADLAGKTDITPTAKVFALLDLLAQRNSARLTDLATALGVPKTTLYRITSQLEQLGYLQREPDGRHLTIAPRLAKLSADILGASARLAPRHAILEALSARLGESCSLGIRIGHQIVYLDDVTAPSPLSFSFGTGQRVPLHCTSTGKLYLAHMISEEFDRFLKHQELRAYTANTITDPQKLRDELQYIVRNGCAYSHGEYVVGVIGAAAPVIDADGRLMAGITVSIPAARMAYEDLPKLAPALLSSAAELAETFNH
jgi:DNA-binding IclR family transcriptional regulator